MGRSVWVRQLASRRVGLTRPRQSEYLNSSLAMGLSILWIGWLGWLVAPGTSSRQKTFEWIGRLDRFGRATRSRGGWIEWIEWMVGGALDQIVAATI